VLRNGTPRTCTVKHSTVIGNPEVITILNLMSHFLIVLPQGKGEEDTTSPTKTHNT